MKKNHKIKILHIINNFGMGGAETFLALLLKYLKEYDDIELVVFTLTGGGPLEKEIMKLGIEYKKFHYHIFTRYVHRFDPFIRPRLLFNVWREKPDIIHGHLLGSDLASKILGGILNIPVITTQHDTMIAHPGEKHYFANRFLTKAVAVSSVVEEYLHKTFRIERNKIVVIPDGIEIEKYSVGKKEYNASCPVLGFVGRLIYLKGVQDIIKSLVLLKNEFPNIKLVVIGDGEYRNELESLSRQLAVSDMIDFKGRLTDTANALAEFDISILPSETEGFSMAVLESCAASKPIIGTCTGAISDMVVSGENGYFVHFGKPEEIYNAVKSILSNNNVEEFGNKSFERVKDDFSIGKVARMYYNLYRDVKKS